MSRGASRTHVAMRVSGTGWAAQARVALGLCGCTRASVCMRERGWCAKRETGPWTGAVQMRAGTETWTAVQLGRVGVGRQCHWSSVLLHGGAAVGRRSSASVCGARRRRDVDHPLNAFAAPHCTRFVRVGVIPGIFWDDEGGRSGGAGRLHDVSMTGFSLSTRPHPQSTSPRAAPTSTSTSESRPAQYPPMRSTRPRRASPSPVTHTPIACCRTSTYEHSSPPGSVSFLGLKPPAASHPIRFKPRAAAPPPFGGVWRVALARRAISFFFFILIFISFCLGASARAWTSRGTGAARPVTVVGVGARSGISVLGHAWRRAHCDSLRGDEVDRAECDASAACNKRQGSGRDNACGSVACVRAVESTDGDGVPLEVQRYSTHARTLSRLRVGGRRDKGTMRSVCLVAPNKTPQMPSLKAFLPSSLHTLRSTSRLLSLFCPPGRITSKLPPRLAAAYARLHRYAVCATREDEDVPPQEEIGAGSGIDLVAGDRTCAEPIDSLALEAVAAARRVGDAHRGASELGCCRRVGLGGRGREGSGPTHTRSPSRRGRQGGGAALCGVCVQAA
ncbi:hypothetical protein C8F04DRAFT_1260007 [Mycena alexandri]|uniref:Uncharacterized protein n=1 Tax=Mycena alexandri TaxID=1745969 RepID=A0AAD6SZB3_9AGAR|nr:hypothetical protein C8F04DRAFT_1260007 [Mycena alexandri]